MHGSSVGRTGGFSIRHSTRWLDRIEARSSSGPLQRVDPITTSSNIVEGSEAQSISRVANLDVFPLPLASCPILRFK